MNTFYVYTLAYPDGKVFYVGKGSKSRIMNHEADARNRDRAHTYHTQRSEIIRQIWHEGGQVLKQKIAFFDNEDDAYAFEMEFIKALGKEQLINLNDGGSGCRSRKTEKDTLVEKLKEVKPEPSLAAQLQRYTSNTRHRLVIDMQKARMLTLLARQRGVSIDHFVEDLIEQAWKEAVQENNADGESVRIVKK